MTCWAYAHLDAQKRATIVKTLPLARGFQPPSTRHDQERTGECPMVCGSAHQACRLLSTSAVAGPLQLAESGYWLSGRCEGLSLLHHVGDENSCFRFPRFTARMRRFRRYLEAIAWFNGAGWLTLNGKFEAPFQDVGRFNSRMCVSRYDHSGVYSRVYQERDISWCRTVHLRQDLSRYAGSCGGLGALGRCFGGNKLANSADRACRKT